MKDLLNKIQQFLLNVITAHTGVSSKRVCGLIGWLCALGVFIYCSITSKQAPEMVNTLLLCCLGLLGVDSITGIWKQNTNK